MFLWNHIDCWEISESEYTRLKECNEQYSCPACYLKSALHEIVQPSLPDFKTEDRISSAKWGPLIGNEIKSVIDHVYEEVVRKPNMFKLPTGLAGRQFLEQITICLN